MIPPGIAFLFCLAFPQIISLVFASITLNILKYLGYFFSSSTHWLLLIGASFGCPAWTLFLARPYAKFRDIRRATEKGAVLPPTVEESSAKIVSAIVQSFDKDYLGEVFLKWVHRYGNTYTYQVYSETRLFTIEPEYVKAILATQFNNFEKGIVGYQQLKSLLGSGVFNSDGDMWKFHRNMTRPFFNKDRISDFDIFDRHAEHTISIIKARLAQGYPIEFQDAIGRFTLDSATEFLFGKDVESLGAGIPFPTNAQVENNDPSFPDHPSNVFVLAFLAGQAEVSRRGRIGDMWPLAEFWSEKVKAHRKHVDDFINPILEEKKKEHLARGVAEKVDDEGDTFLDHLIQSTDDEQVIRDELVNILVAGRDTTASLLTFAIYVLTERPDLTERLRKEILEFVGPRARPTYKIISEMKYLRAFLNETLRLYPAVPLNSRYSKMPVILPSLNGQTPLYIPAGVKCVYSVFLMHRREDLWGPDALKFDPDRFMDKRAQYQIRNPFIFMPFNAGPRICIGQQFAYNEASYFLIRFLQSFSNFEMDWEAQTTRSPEGWKPAPGTTKGRDKVVLAYHLTMVIKPRACLECSDALQSGLTGLTALNCIDQFPGWIMGQDEGTGYMLISHNLAVQNWFIVTLTPLTHKSQWKSIRKTCPLKE